MEKKTFDAVRWVRETRDRNAKEMSGRSPAERIAFIREKAERVHRELDQSKAENKAT
jgi:hypothetical protein